MNWKSLKFKDLCELQLAIQYLDWDELAHDLIKLEEECTTLKEYLKPKEIKQIQRLIALYEAEKRIRINKNTDNSKQIRGPREAGAGWLEDDVDDLGL